MKTKVKKVKRSKTKRQRKIKTKRKSINEFSEEQPGNRNINKIEQLERELREINIILNQIDQRLETYRTRPKDEKYYALNEQRRLLDTRKNNNISYLITLQR